MGKKSGTLHYLPEAFHVDTAREQNLIGSKISVARRNAHLKQAELVKKLTQYGVHITVTSLHRWEVGENVPSGYQLLALCHALNITDGLQAFTGSIAERSDPLNRTGRQMVNDYEQMLIESGRYAPVKRLSRPKTHMPVLRPVLVNINKASAGTGDYLNEEAFETRELPETLIPDEPYDFAVQVDGNSMEPSFMNGQYVFVKTCSHLYPGEIGLFVVDGDGFIKEYDEETPEEAEEYMSSDGVLHMRPVLVSHNPDYLPRKITPDQDFRIVGRIVTR